MDAFAFFSKTTKSARSVILGQIKDLEVGELIKVDLDGMSIAKARAYIFQYQNDSNGKKFKTKVQKEDKSLMLGRVA